MFKHTTRQLQVRLLTRPSVIAMMLATIALALASAERTFQGMRNFTGAAGDDQQFGTAVSFLITFGVQVLLVILSWRIGDAYASDAARSDTAVATPPPATPPRPFRRLVGFIGRRFIVRHFLLVVSFLFCAFVCVFFSFDAFYQGISTSKQRDIVSRGEAARVLRAIDAEVTSDLADQGKQAASRLSSGQAWNTYKSSIQRVVDAATDPALVEAAKVRAKQKEDEAKQRADEASKQAEARQKVQNQAEAEVGRLQNEKQRLEGEANEAATKVTTLKAQAEDRRKQLADKDAEVTKTQQLMDAEDKIGQDRLNAKGELDVGKGPKWKALKAKFDLQVADKRRLAAEVRELERSVTTADRNSRDADAKFQKAALDLSNAETALDAIKAKSEAAATVERQQADATDGLANVAGEATLLDGLPAKFFGDRTSENWANIEKQCVHVVDLLRETPEGRAKIEALQCEPPVETRALATSFFAIGQRQTALKQGCTDQVASATSFLNLVALGRTCLNIAQLQDGVAKGLEDDLDQVAEEQDEKAHTFVRTISAFKRGDKLAYIALAIALSLDGLIVLSGIWGARANASELTRGKEITVSEIDDHARMVMAVEVRPERLRPATGWHEPPEVYKARLFLKHIRRYHDPAQPQFAGVISSAELGEQERAAINSVLAIGAFARPVEDRSGDDTWLVTWRLIHYVTAVAGKFDRVERIRQATTEKAVSAARPPEPASVEASRPSESERGSSSDYWKRAAAAAKSRPTAGSETELMEREYVDRAHEGLRHDAVSVDLENDNSIVPPDWSASQKGGEAAAG
jgi:hypothetical protein